MLKPELCDSAGQPSCWVLMTLRVLWYTPVSPQVAEQSVQLDQAETVQGSGHGVLLQNSICISRGQALPPCAGWVFTLRLRNWWPWSPHVSEHAVQSVHEVTSQSTGQALPPLVGEQNLSSVSGGQVLPPCAASVITLRVRTWVPTTPSVPHVMLHVGQLPHSDTLQSTGHLTSVLLL